MFVAFRDAPVKSHPADLVSSVLLIPTVTTYFLTPNECLAVWVPQLHKKLKW